MTRQEVEDLISRVSIKIFEIDFNIHVLEDKKYGNRLYIQGEYFAKCNKDPSLESYWYTRKYYLSDHMSSDEIIKTCYVCFEQAVKHEVMECFKVDNKILFNPHINFEELLKVSDKEISRKS
jgi:hypothetical protein